MWRNRQRLVLMRRILSCVILCACVVLLAMPTQAHAQKINTTVNRDKIRIGDPFDLKITLETSNNQPLNITHWLVLPDTFGSFQVVTRKPIDTLEVGNAKSYSQTFTLTCFDSGTFQLPPFPILLNGKDTVSSRTIPITVLTVDVSQMKDFNDIKDILEPAEDAPFFQWWMAGAVVIVLLILLLVARKIRQRKVPTPPTSIPITKETAWQQLSALEALIAKGLYTEFYIQLHSLCKRMAARYYGFAADPATTTELLQAAHRSCNNQQMLAQLTAIVQMADTVKFAHTKPTEQECKNSFSEAKQWLQQLMLDYPQTPTKPNAL